MQQPQPGLSEAGSGFADRPGFHGACHRAGHFGPDPLAQSGLRQAHHVVFGLVPPIRSITLPLLSLSTSLVIDQTPSFLTAAT